MTCPTGNSTTLGQVRHTQQFTFHLPTSWVNVQQSNAGRTTAELRRNLNWGYYTWLAMQDTPPVFFSMGRFQHSMDAVGTHQTQYSTVGVGVTHSFGDHAGAEVCPELQLLNFHLKMQFKPMAGVGKSFFWRSRRG